MSNLIKRSIKELRFVGGRFEQSKGWLDFDILPELQVYKRILVETAKEEWKRRNPERGRLPKGFEENIRLGFHEIRDGSCTVPVERLIGVDDGALFEYIPDEIDEAARIIDETLIAVRDDTTLPEHLPTRVLQIFEEWGKTLAADEGIVLGNRNGDSPRFDVNIRSRLLSARTERYEDTVDFVGEVRAAELKAVAGGSFSIQSENGETVPGAFTSEQEETITDALHEHHRLRLRIVGLGEFEPGGRLRRIMRVDRLEEHPVGETPFDPEVPPIWEVVATIGRSVPEEAWGKVPTDLAANLDRYLYGDRKGGER